MEHRSIKHLIGCPAQRIESHTLSAPTGKWRVSRCGDCGAQTELRIGPPRKIDSEGLAPADVAGGNRWTAHQPESPAYMRRPTTDDLLRRNGA